jgi:hypothetical protein
MINFNKCGKRFCSIEFDGIANSRALYRLEQLTCGLLFQLNYESMSSWVVSEIVRRSVEIEVRSPCGHCNCLACSLAVLNCFYYQIGDVSSCFSPI